MTWKGKPCGRIWFGNPDNWTIGICPHCPEGTHYCLGFLWFNKLIPVISFESLDEMKRFAEFVDLLVKAFRDWLDENKVGKEREEDYPEFIKRLEEEFFK